ncbi:MAG: O-antigen ligase family protein [Planctomycetaceae bacterium]|nr:O-antigen ligase family protein [Planctomycetaceae bacterium]
MPNLMLLLLGGYLWLFLHRPFEIWHWLGDLRIERVYMIITCLYWLVLAEKGWISNRLNVALTLFWGVVLASCFFSPFDSNVEGYLKISLLYLLLITTVRNERDLRFIIVMFLIAMGLYMGHSFREYLCGRYIFRMGIARMIGVDETYSDPNTFSASILYSLTLVYPAWDLARRPWHRRLLMAYVGLSVICILLTGSRSAFVGLCALVLVATLLSQYRLKIAVALVVAAPVVWLMLSDSLQNRFLTLIDPSYGPANAQVSAESREQGWLDGVKMWQEHPMLGVGPGCFPQARGYPLESHQLYGQVLGELGTLGAITFGLVVLAFFANYFQLLRVSRAQPWIRGTFPAKLIQAITLTVILLLLMGFGGHNLYRYTWVWFGAFQAIALRCLLQWQCHPADSVLAAEGDAAALPPADARAALQG